MIYACSKIFKLPVLIRSSGGIHNYLYQLRMTSHDSTPVKVQGSNVLGKFQITWRTNLGEPGRLQTQQILGTVSSFFNIHRQESFILLDFDVSVYLQKYSPFYLFFHSAVCSIFSVLLKRFSCEVID